MKDKYNFIRKGAVRRQPESSTSAQIPFFRDYVNRGIGGNGGKTAIRQGRLIPLWPRIILY